MPKNTVVVDRTTGFGNPFRVAKGKFTCQGVEGFSWIVGTFEGPAMWILDDKDKALTVAVSAFRTWINLDKQSNLRDKARSALRGKNLACWCALDKPCHAEVLLEIANKKETLNEG